MNYESRITNYGEPGKDDVKEKNLDAQPVTFNPEDSEVAFVPKDVIRSFDNVFGWMQEAQQELIKVAEGMRAVGN